MTEKLTACPACFGKPTVGEDGITQWHRSVYDSVPYCRECRQRIANAQIERTGSDDADQLTTLLHATTD